MKIKEDIVIQTISEIKANLDWQRGILLFKKEIMKYRLSSSLLLHDTSEKQSYVNCNKFFLRRTTDAGDLKLRVMNEKFRTNSILKLCQTNS